MKVDWFSVNLSQVRSSIVMEDLSGILIFFQLVEELLLNSESNFFLEIHGWDVIAHVI